MYARVLFYFNAAAGRLIIIFFVPVGRDKEFVAHYVPFKNYVVALVDNYFVPFQRAQQYLLSLFYLRDIDEEAAVVSYAVAVDKADRLIEHPDERPALGHDPVYEFKGRIGGHVFF